MRPKVTPIETKKLREDDGGGRIVLNKTESSKALWVIVIFLGLSIMTNFMLISKLNERTIRLEVIHELSGD